MGALWVRQSAKGEYMTGTVKIGETSYPIVVFKNSYKKADNQPDWRIYESVPKEKKPEEVDTSSVPF